MGQFLIILFIILGYFIALSVLMSRSDNRRSLSAMAVILLLVYGCTVGMAVAIGQYLGELGLLLYGFALVYSCLYWGWKLYRMVQQKPQIQTGALLTFFAYLLAVLYITTFMREGGTNFKVQMEVLNWLKESAQTGSGEAFNHVLLNVAMFVPVGVLYPLITNEDRGKVLGGISFGMLFSVLIETGQLLFHYGACDIDDILANTLGAAIGSCITVVGKRLGERTKRSEKGS